MKIVTLFGTRPEIIRLSRIIPALDNCCEQVLVHTGQNFDPRLSEVFLDELQIRKVDHRLGIQASSFGEQAGQLLARIDELITNVRPDRMLILGDTNSGLAAIIAARRGVPVFHLEAGNRCYDNRVPEEVNRRIIDHSSDVLLPYTQRSAENLVAEGIRRDRIFVVGNPILEVLEYFAPQIDGSDILHRLALTKGGYFLVTMHRAENVDRPERLATYIGALARLADEFGKPALLSVHPRTAQRLAAANIRIDSEKLRLEQPFGLFDFVQLEKNAFGVVTDSGTVQEEACIFGVPNVTIRDVTERPETLECGSNSLCGADPSFLLSGMRLAISSTSKWIPPAEYTKRNVAASVARITAGYRPVGVPCLNY
jgi:UDP-N-acetylglucosamine 2-epimerase (non-hydrolysing)